MKVGAGDVDNEDTKFPYSAEVTVPRGGTSGPLAIGALLDTGMGITCVSESLVAKMEVQFPVQRCVFPVAGKQPRERVADGQQV